MYKLKITVERIDGYCNQPMLVGDCFFVDGGKIRIPDGKHFCIYALAAVLPLLPAKQRAIASADWMAHDQEVACPDPDERCIMRIEQIGVSRMTTDERT